MGKQVDHRDVAIGIGVAHAPGPLKAVARLLAALSGTDPVEVADTQLVPGGPQTGGGRLVEEAAGHIRSESDPAAGHVEDGKDIQSLGIVVEEAQANRADIFDYAGKSTVAEDYRSFIEEFLKGVNE